MANLTLSDIAEQSGETSDRGTFKAPPLQAVILDHEGHELGTVELEARAYTPKPDKVGRVTGGIGWFGSLPKSTKFGKLGLSGQVRISVAGVKIGVGDTVNLMPEEPEAAE